MHIRNLHIEGFTSHTLSSFTLAPLSIFRGQNGAGKSSIPSALEYLFAGRCDATDDRGAGARDLIRRGEDKSLICAEVVIDKAVRTLRCSLTEKSGRSVSVKDGKEDGGTDWLDYLTSKREVLSCLINTHHFVDMDPAKQKELLAAIVLPGSYDWPQSIRDAAHNAGLGITWSLRPFDLIAQAYKLAYDERTGINRELKAWREPEKLEPPAMSVEEIRSRLKERQDERTKLAVEKQRRAGEAAERARVIEQAREKVRTLTAKLEMERQELNAVSNRLLDTRTIKEVKKAAGMRAAVAKTDAEIAQLTRDVAEQKERTQKIADLSVCPECPTCRQAITDEILNSIFQPENKKLGDMQSRLAKLHYDRKELGNPEEAQKQLDAHKQAEEETKTVEYRIKEAEKALAEAQECASARPPEAESGTEEIDSRLAELDVRIGKGNGALQVAIEADSKGKAYQQAIANKASLDKKLALLETLVEYFGPKGVQAKLLDEHVGGFERAMNKVLGKWGFNCRLVFEPYGFYLATINDAGGIAQTYSLRTISASQRYRFAVAFQIALASATGFRFAVVDGADILDNDARPKLYAALREAEMEQIIVLQTDDRRQVPAAPGTAFWMLTSDVVNGVPTTTAERL